jgi:predicted lysophospholipase L1 biosynthesis ABC-type transport system permease subunit
LGKQFGSKGPDGLALPQSRIVAVVSDAKYRSLREHAPPTLYAPIVGGFDADFILHLRAPGDPSALIKPVRQILHSLDPELPFVEAAPLRADVEATLWQERLLAWFSSILAAFAAILAGLGLYGALDYAVRSRTREVGIRLALGAHPSAIIRLLSNQILWLVVLGSALGLYSYFLAATWIRRLLFDVTPFDPQPLALAITFALMATLVSIAIPIWKATRIEPSSALRHE